MKKTKSEALDLFRSFIMKERKDLPWLKNRLGMLDCAAAVSYITERKPEIISCGAFVAQLKKEKAWHTLKDGLPKQGQLVFFDWSGHEGNTGNHDHVGIVLNAAHDHVEYISADSTKPVPGLVTINKHVGWHWVSGYADVNYAKPAPAATPAATTSKPVAAAKATKPSEKAI